MATETSQRQSRIPKPIAMMGPWDFWADPHTIGLPPEDAAAIFDGTALPEQIDRAQKFGEAAKMALIAADGVYPLRLES